MHYVPRATKAAAVATTLLMAAACTPRREVARQINLSDPSPGRHATIVSIRPVADGGMRGAILGALGAAMAAAPARPAARPFMTANEFIVRDDLGHTLSVVQANFDGFRVGQHVLLIGDARTRLARTQVADAARHT